MEKQIIINHLSELKKKELIVYIDAAWETMTEPQRRSVFGVLFELIRLMERGENIVFAHELGDWMITAKHDYQKVYKELQTHQK
jgi:hypothetical protein